MTAAPGGGAGRPARSYGEAYPGATWDRLVEVNDRYDPTNQFRHNQNIPPSMPLNNSSPRSHAQGWRNCRLGWLPREGVP